jgi:hypothetical protein
LQWTSAALFDSPEAALPDLRDPKIGVTPDKRLMVMGAATSRQENAGRGNYVWFSGDGRAWSTPKAMGGSGDWIWSSTWSEKIFYGASYGNQNGIGVIKLYRGADALHLQEPIILHRDALYPNETALLMEGENGLAIIRREFASGQTKPQMKPPSDHGTALLANSRAPFEQWTTRDSGVYVGGPALLRLPGGKVVVAGRKIVSGQHTTTLWELDEANARLQERSTLPSGGDCSYPGLFWHEEKLWVSYYSSHEEKTSIYLAEVEVR